MSKWLSFIPGSEFMWKRTIYCLQYCIFLKYFETAINHELNISADGFNMYFILYVWIMNILLNACVQKFSRQWIASVMLHKQSLQASSKSCILGVLTTYQKWIEFLKTRKDKRIEREDSVLMTLESLKSVMVMSFERIS